MSIRENNAILALRESWPGAFLVKEPVRDMRQEADRVAAGLVQGDRGELDRLFDSMDSSAPELVWSPASGDLSCDILAFLRHYWAERRRGTELPLSREIDALDLVPALGYIMLMEPLEGGSDFLYRVYGSRIVDYSKTEMTGKRVWDVPSPLVAAYFAASYRAVCIRREPLYTFHRSRLAQFHAQWERLILPFVNEQGDVTRLLVGNVPSLQR